MPTDALARQWGLGGAVHRFSSIKYSPIEARRLLRRRFEQHLSAHVSPQFPREQKGVVDDHTLLLAIQSLNLSPYRDAERFRDRYASESEGKDVPSFDELVDAHILDLCWGRVSFQHELVRMLEGAEVPLSIALLPVLKNRPRLTAELGSEPADPAAAALARTIVEKEDIKVPLSPDTRWVAARLWERRDHESEENEQLEQWVLRWELLGSPWFRPSQVWARDDLEAFRRSVLAVARTEPSMLGWEAERSRRIRALAIRGGKLDAPELYQHVTAAPASWFGRWQWLEQRTFDYVRHISDARSHLVGAVRLVLRDAALEEYAKGAPHPVVQEVLELAEERPALEELVAQEARIQPALLADLLLWPPTSAWACAVVVSWPGHAGAWDRAIVEEGARALVEEALADALGVLSHHVEAGAANAVELASLIVWSRDHFAPPTHQPLNRELERQVDHFYSTLESSLACEVAKAVWNLETTPPRCTDGRFLTYLHVAAAAEVPVAELAAGVAPSLVLLSYVLSIVEGPWVLGRELPSPAEAAVLARLAEFAGAETWRYFLRPCDFGSEAKATYWMPVKDRLDRVSTIQRGVRAHFRVLARSLIGWEGLHPEELEEAALAALRLGSHANLERGRVAAFTARDELEPFAVAGVEPVAKDILGLLESGLPSRRLLTRLLELDEPLVLAQVAQEAAEGVSEQVLARLEELTPDEAGSVTSLPEAEARIDALMNAGAFDAAERFMEQEAVLRTLGPVADRPHRRLQRTLRLLLERKDYAAVLTFERPEAGRAAEEATIDFYVALAEFSRDGGDLARAEQLLERLAGQNQTSATYSVNLSAVRLARAVRGDALPAPRECWPAVRRVIEEMHEGWRRFSGASVSDDITTLHQTNLALAYLAVARPAEALGCLEAVPEPHRDDPRVAAYAASALVALGRKHAAQERLTRAQAKHPSSETLMVAVAELGDGYFHPPGVSAVRVEDVEENVRRALLELRTMEPESQARAFGSPGTDLESFLVSNVRAASACIPLLAPMLKGVDKKTKEDDVTALVQRILAARLERLGWDVGDQSFGGRTPKGGPGERDLKIQWGSDRVLTLIEAVVGRDPITQHRQQTDLTSHFQKLLAYGQCRIYFHLTYLFAGTPKSYLDFLRGAARDEALPEFPWLREETIESKDNWPDGFAAEYDGPYGSTKVYFFVLDVRQEVLQQSAAIADATKHRPAPKKPKPMIGKKGGNKEALGPATSETSVVEEVAPASGGNEDAAEAEPPSADTVAVADE